MTSHIKDAAWHLWQCEKALQRAAKTTDDNREIKQAVAYCKRLRAVLIGWTSTVTR